MKILFVTTEIPYPPDNGVRIKSYHALRLMARDHEVAVVSLTSETDNVEARVEHLRGLCEFVTVVPLRKRSLASMALGCALRSKLLYMERYRDPAFPGRLNEIIREWQPQVVHFDLIPLSQYGAVIDARVARIASINDSYALSLENVLNRSTQRPLTRRLYDRYQLFMTRKFEARVYAEYDYCHVMTAVDQEYLRRLNPNMRVISIPNGIDVDYLKPAEHRPEEAGRNAVFVARMGGMNVVFLEEFLTKAWVRVRQAVPDANLNVVGGNPPAALQELGKRIGGVTFKGYVDDLRDAYNDSMLSVVPVRKDCGIVNKAIEAMAMELAVVGFKETFAGIPHARHDQECVSSTSYEDMADGLIQLYKEPARAAEIGNAARQMIEQHYSWEHRRKAYDEMYSSAVKLRQERCGG